MGQLTIYLDSDTEARMKAAAAAARTSRSRWVAELIREKTTTQWPRSVIEALGSWPEAPLVSEIRDGTGEDAPREPW